MTLAALLLAMLLSAAAQAAPLPEQIPCTGTTQVPDANPVASPNALFSWVQTAAKQVNAGIAVPNLHPSTSYLQAKLGRFQRHVLVCIYPDAPGDALCPPPAALPAGGDVLGRLLMTSKKTLTHECYDGVPWKGHQSSVGRNKLLRHIVSPIQQRILKAAGCWG
ncbi:MAG TPA: hypothetical protein VMR98_05530, partial [Candidatus Polarisedimenticolaceae bacterium]|nr:hypothetical protein [Candidatus Polarisedimenticolaceae bacterium]